MTCNRCGQHEKMERQSYCKECYAAYHREWRRQRAERLAPVIAQERAERQAAARANETESRQKRNERMKLYMRKRREKEAKEQKRNEIRARAQKERELQGLECSDTEMTRDSDGPSTTPASWARSRKLNQ